MKDEAFNNKRIRRIAREHHCTVAEVEHALDHHAVNSVNRDKYLSRLLALELVELDEMQEFFRQKALAEGDVASGALVAKLFERRATMLGLNAPAASAVQVIEHAAPPAQTSTERIRAAIDRLIAQRQPKAGYSTVSQNGDGEPEPDKPVE